MPPELDVDAMLQRFRDRAHAVRQRGVPPIEGADRKRFVDQARTDFMDYAMIGDAIATLEGDPDPDDRPAGPESARSYSPGHLSAAGPRPVHPGRRPWPSRANDAAPLASLRRGAPTSPARQTLPEAGLGLGGQELDHVAAGGQEGGVHLLVAGQLGHPG